MVSSGLSTAHTEDLLSHAGTCQVTPGLSSAHACSSQSQRLPDSQELLSPLELEYTDHSGRALHRTNMSFAIEERGKPNTQEYRVFFSKHISLDELS